MSEEIFLNHEILTEKEEQRIAADLISAKKSLSRFLDGSLSYQEHTEIQKKAAEARYRLITQNRRFVLKVASRFRIVPPLSQSDLISEGTLGLIRSIESFDPKQGRFLTYAGHFIHQAIVLFLIRNGANVSVPHWVQDEINCITAVRDTLYQELQRVPTAEEISVKTGKPVSKVEEILSVIHDRYEPYKSICFDQKVQINDPSSERPEAETNNHLVKHLVNESIKTCLSERESLVVRMYYGIGYDDCFTLEEISKKLNLTKERVRQIREDAQKKLGNILDGDLIHGI